MGCVGVEGGVEDAAWRCPLLGGGAGRGCAWEKGGADRHAP